MLLHYFYSFTCVVVEVTTYSKRENHSFHQPLHSGTHTTKQLLHASRPTQN